MNDFVFCIYFYSLDAYLSNISHLYGKHTYHKARLGLSLS